MSAGSRPRTASAPNGTESFETTRSPPADVHSRLSWCASSDSNVVSVIVAGDVTLTVILAHLDEQVSVTVTRPSSIVNVACDGKFF